MDFSEKVRTIRKSKGLKQSDLADMLEVKRSTVGKWETGDNRPTLEVLERMADLFQTSIDDLLCRKPVIEKYKRDDQNVKLLSYYSKLNDFGKREAVKRVSELCLIPQYTAKEAVNNMPIAAHSDKEITDKELELMRQDIDEL